MSKIHPLIIALKNHVSAYEIKNTSVSNATVGWHIHHSLMVIDSVIHGIQNSDPSKYRYQWNKNRWFIYLLGKIPRGKGKAPKYVRPEVEFSPNDLLNFIENVERKLSIASELPVNAYIMHPYFGMLNKKQSLRFIILHTKHHLKIIQDILNSVS